MEHPSSTRTTHPGRRTRVVAALAITGVLAGCSLSSGGSTDQSPSATGSDQGSTARGGTVTLLTHSSFSVDKALLAQFRAETGYTVKVAPSGDAGELANKLVLTKNSPLGDAVFGIDNTFAGRVTGADVLEPYTPSAMPSGAKRYALPESSDAARLTPVDTASTCVNVDTAWFAKHKRTPPASFDDLIKPEYKNLFVTPGPPTSSPGLAMLLATIGKYGQDGWQGWWSKLTANGAKYTSGWSDAYNVDFSGGEGKGDRPIVLSYDTSPAFTVSGGKSSTAALLDTCFRQVEYAGALKGAKNPAGAKALVDWLVGKKFQASLPESMYVFPVDDQVSLPTEWTKFAKQPSDPWTVSPTQIEKNRTTWLQQWQNIASR